MTAAPNNASVNSAKIDVPASLTGADRPGFGSAIDFEQVYADARGEASRVPWAAGCACPVMAEWLNTEAPLLVRPGSRAVVVGCGLGDDVVELAGRGYDVLGFDLAPTAVRWAALRHPAHAARFLQADLLNMPARLQRRFDLVVEVNTIQSIAPEARPMVAKALGNLLAPRGVMLAVCRGRDQAQPLNECLGPPWPLTPTELHEMLAGAGLYPVHGEPAVIEAWDQEEPPKRRLRGTFTRV